MNKTYGYTRVSTREQTADGQRDAIAAHYPDALVLGEEPMSGTVPPRERPTLGILLNQILQEGDTLVVAAIDRIGRNARDTLELVEEMEKRKINLISLREGVELNTATGKSVIGVVASFAEMERTLILERQAAGKKRGQKFGRPTKIGATEVGEIVTRRAMGVPIASIAKQLKLSRSAIYRCLEKIDAKAPE